jgi:hypothetical protein
MLSCPFHYKRQKVNIYISPVELILFAKGKHWEIAKV